MDFNKLFQSKTLKLVILIIAILIFALLIFRLGVMVGFEKANFSYKWGENYHNNFAGPKHGFMANMQNNDFENRDFVDSHGTFGQIMKIDNSNIILKSKDNLEKNILVKNDTSIMRFRDSIKVSDLKISDYIVVIGDSNNSGQIEARLIRIMPDPNIANRPPMPNMLNVQSSSTNTK